MSEGTLCAVIFVVAFGWIVAACVGIIAGMFFASVREETERKLRKAIQRIYYRKRRKDQLARARMLRERFIEQECRRNYYGDL